MHQRLGAVGRGAGIEFKFGGRVGNSRDSHRVVWLAKKKNGPEGEAKAIDGLFRAYFEEEKDITDYSVLRSVAKQAGVPEDEFEKAIVQSDEGGQEVDRMVRAAAAGGVTGVPDFNIQNKYSFSGARAPEEMVELWEKIKEREG